MKEKRSFGRLTIGGAYYEIALKAFMDRKRMLESIKRIKGGEKTINVIVGRNLTVDPPHDVHYSSDVETVVRRVWKLISHEEFKIIIFMCTFLEFYIWEFGAIVLGDDFAKKNLSVLQTVSKWKVIPMLITGKQIDLEEREWAIFTSLVRTRNELIHYKSENLIDLIENGTLQKKSKKAIHTINFDILFQFVKTLFKKLDEIDEEGSHVHYIRTYEQQSEENDSLYRGLI